MKLAQQLNIQAEYETSFLVECLKKNKAEHVKEYGLALKNYHKIRSERANVLIMNAEKIALDPANPMNSCFKSYNDLTSLTEPVDASKMYDEYIALLAASTSKTVKMEVSDANAIINDQWEWARAAKFSNSFYTSGVN